MGQKSLGVGNRIQTDMIDLCPFCSTRLAVFYRMRTQEAIAYCPNVGCRATRSIEGVGECTEEAKSNFHGKCLKLEPNNETRKRNTLKTVPD